MDERKKLEAATDDFFAVVEEVIRGGGSVNLTVTGNSMYPMLRDRADSVTLVPPPVRLRRFDLPLYRRENGKYVLHRVVRAKDGVYTMCGDNQTGLETGITQEQIVAVAQSFSRNGRRFSCANPIYRLLAAVWGLLRPMRPAVLRVYLGMRRKLSKRRDEA